MAYYWSGSHIYKSTSGAASAAHLAIADPPSEAAIYSGSAWYEPPNYAGVYREFLSAAGSDSGTPIAYFQVVRAGAVGSDPCPLCQRAMSEVPDALQFTQDPVAVQIAIAGSAPLVFGTDATAEQSDGLIGALHHQGVYDAECRDVIQEICDRNHLTVVLPQPVVI